MGISFAVWVRFFLSASLCSSPHFCVRNHHWSLRKLQLFIYFMGQIMMSVDWIRRFVASITMLNIFCWWNPPLFVVLPCLVLDLWSHRQPRRQRFEGRCAGCWARCCWGPTAGRRKKLRSLAKGTKKGIFTLWFGLCSIYIYGGFLK